MGLQSSSQIAQRLRRLKCLEKALKDPLSGSERVIFGHFLTEIMRKWMGKASPGTS